jgi:hypothetical protein
MGNQLMAGRGERFRSRPGDGVVLLEVHEIRNDSYVAADTAERPVGLVTQKGRDGRNRVGLLDGEAGYPVEARLLAYQRDVGAVQSRDHAEFPRTPEHFPREVGGGGVGDCIVHVQDFQLFPKCDLVLLRGQRERVGIVIEQRVTSHPRFYLVEVNPLGVATKPERRVIGNEMDFMPPTCQRQTELGCHGSRPTVGRIAGNPDSHACTLSSHAAAISAASFSGDRVASRSSTGAESWCRNHVSCRLA